MSPIVLPAKQDLIDALAKALGLTSLKASTTPDDVRPAAERLLLLSPVLWEQAAHLRSQQTSEGSMAGLHPVMQAVLSMEEVVWETIAKLRPKYAQALKDKNATVREFILKSTAIALVPRENVPIHRDASPLEAEEEADARADVEAFYNNYRKYRPAHLTTQADVAKAAGISVGTVATIEKLGAKPHYATVVKLAQAFGVTPEQMLRPQG